jgi:hypothetical protein
MASTALELIPTRLASALRTGRTNARRLRIAQMVSTALELIPMRLACALRIGPQETKSHTTKKTSDGGVPPGTIYAQVRVTVIFLSAR